MVVRVGIGRNSEMLVKGYTVSVIRLFRPKDLIYNIVTIVDNTLLYNWNLLRE